MAKTGRPTKYNAEVMLPILEELAEGNGCYMEQLPYRLGIVKQTLHNWMNPEHDTYAGPEFLDAVKAVQAARDNWLLNQADRHITGDDATIIGNSVIRGSSSMLALALKNVVNWRDKTEVEQTNREIIVED